MHVIVSGQIRHDGCTHALLKRLAGARKRKEVEQVIFVVWDSQETRARRLLDQLPSAVDRVLVVREPEAIVPGHFFHQVRGLETGLVDLPQTDWVLRLRPDIFVEEGFIPTVRDHMTRAGRPLWTPYADLLAPFFACDIVFGGRVQALRDQANYSMEPYLNTIPAMASRDSAAARSHEPEIHRWLYPTRDADWCARAYWSSFASFGYATTLRWPLIARFRDWGFFQAIRRRWLDYLDENVSLGGFGNGARAGLIRIEPDAMRGSLWWLQGFDEPETFSSDAALERETTAFTWTSSSEKVADFRRFLNGRATDETPQSSDDVHEDLKEHWRVAGLNADSASPKIVLPFKISTAVYSS